MKKEVPLPFKLLSVISIIVAFYFFFPKDLGEKANVETKVAQVDQIIYNAVPRDVLGDKVLATFYGQLTGYGPDCAGCSGRGITASGYSISNGNIYYQDDTYGEVRIVAADPRFDFGTIVRITAPNIDDSPIIAVVLDTGSAIHGNIFDLAFENEAQTKAVGRQKNVKYEILRYGW
jgi:3D (Asp-Asp-Asp) domain-containing protein